MNKIECIRCRAAGWALGLALWAFAAAPVSGQHEGRVTDENGKPVAFANVAALSPADSSVVAATLSREDGVWQLPEGTSVELLRFTALGYEPLYYRAEAPLTSLAVTLRPVASQLGEAGVTVKRPVAQLKDGALVTTVENTSLAHSGTAEDVLRQVPGLIKKNDEEGSLEVIGRGKPLIYINGREMRDAEELKQLRSEDIKSVEVILNPGARYDASVTSVVRIRTVRKRGEGWTLDLSADYYQGTYGTFIPRAKVGWRRGGWDFSVGGGYRQGKSYWHSVNEQFTDAPGTLWRQTFSERSRGKGKNADMTAELNYEFNERHSVGARYQMSKQIEQRSLSTIEGDIEANGAPYDRLGNTIDGEDEADPQHNLNVYYVGRLGKGELSLNADFYANGSTSENRYDEESSEYEDRNFPTISCIRNRLVSGKAQYEWPWLGGKVAVGAQYTFTNRHDDYRVVQNDFGLATSQTRMRERTAAGFAQYSAVWAKRWQFSAGLRYEHQETEYFVEKVKQHEQSPTYDNLFPSLSLATTAGKVQLMASYAMRTSRPSYWQLSNNVTYGNRFLLQGGNPALKPTITHTADLTAVWKFMQANVSFTRYQDGIVSYGIPLPDNPSVTKILPVNQDWSTLTATLTAAPDVAWWHPSLTLVYYQNYNSVENMGKKVSLNNPCAVVIANQGFDLPWKISFHLNYRFQSRGDVQNVTLYRTMHDLGCYASRSFLGSALNVVVGGDDLIHKAQPQVRLYMASATFKQWGEGDSRRFYVKVSYKLNAMRNKYKGGSTLDDVLRRL